MNPIVSLIRIRQKAPGRPGPAKTTFRILLVVCAVTMFASGAARATFVDLRQPNSSGSVNTLHGTIFFGTDTTQPAGSGVFDPFLTIQAIGTEQGYNSSNRNAPFDVKRIPTYNHEFTVGEMKANSKVFIGNEVYFRFLIDVNEPNGTDDKALISLDSLKLFTSTVAGQKTTNVESLGVKRFDLDLNPLGAFYDSYLIYDDRNHGSGQADIAFYIPESAFAGAADSEYVYMYQKWGENAAADPVFAPAGGGYEETRFGGTIIPEASAFFPFAGLLLLVVGSRRRHGA